MAIQKGPIKIEGTLGGMTFLHTKDGYLVKERTTLNGAKIKSDPRFKRTRENMSEFTRAANAGKLLRNSITTLLKGATDHRSVSRLHGEMMRVVKADATSTRGQRNVLDGELELLKYFEFNLNAPLSTTFQADYSAAIDRVTGEATIDILGYVPEKLVVIPEGATHFKLISGFVEIDFEARAKTLATFESAFIAWNNTAQPATSINMALAPASTHPLFLLLGIQFYQLVNGQQYPLINGSFNALQLIRVEGV